MVPTLGENTPAAVPVIYLWQRAASLGDVQRIKRYFRIIISESFDSTWTRWFMTACLLRHTYMIQRARRFFKRGYFVLTTGIVLRVYSQSLSRVATRDYERCRLIWDAPVTQVCARLKWNRKPDARRIDRWRRKKDNPKRKRRKCSCNSSDFQADCIGWGEARRIDTRSHERSRSWLRSARRWEKERERERHKTPP